MSVTKERRSLDPELLALSRLDRILSRLDHKQRLRCIDWLCDKYSVSGPIMNTFHESTSGQE